jgi:hypothetical protein
VIKIMINTMFSRMREREDESKDEIKGESEDESMDEPIMEKDDEFHEADHAPNLEFLILKLIRTGSRSCICFGRP